MRQLTMVAVGMMMSALSLPAAAQDLSGLASQFGGQVQPGQVQRAQAIAKANGIDDKQLAAAARAGQALIEASSGDCDASMRVAFDKALRELDSAGLIAEQHVQRLERLFGTAPGEIGALVGEVNDFRKAINQQQSYEYLAARLGSPRQAARAQKLFTRGAQRILAQIASRGSSFSRTGRTWRVRRTGLPTGRWGMRIPALSLKLQLDPRRRGELAGEACGSIETMTDRQGNAVGQALLVALDDSLALEMRGSGSWSAVDRYGEMMVTTRTDPIYLTRRMLATGKAARSWKQPVCVHQFQREGWTLVGVARTARARTHTMFAIKDDRVLAFEGLNGLMDRIRVVRGHGARVLLAEMIDGQRVESLRYRGNDLRETSAAAKDLKRIVRASGPGYQWTVGSVRGAIDAHRLVTDAATQIVTGQAIHLER